MKLVTIRTIMRPLNILDAEDFYMLNMDTDVIRYTGDDAFENIEKAKDFLAQYDQYEKFGVGRLAVIEKETSKFIGWCGLKYHPEDDLHDIGFRFFKEYWNKGYATETAARCLEYGLSDLALPRIVGHAMKDNLASIRVLEKIGMNYSRDITMHGQPAELYEV